MRVFRRISFLILCGSPVLAVPPVISPSTPVVNQSATISFTETQSEAGTWSCSATNSTGGVTACSGSINSGTGVYTATSTITPQHTYGGMQIGPNNDVWNVRIDSLPVHSSSTLYMNTINAIGLNPKYFADFPFNYVLPTGTTDLMNFTYTAGNNGTFEVPSFPTAQAEHGWFSCLENLNDDHHVVMVDTVTSVLSEFYQFYPNCVSSSATLTGSIATLTCTRNPKLNGFLVGSTVTVGGFSGADTYFNVASATLTVVSNTQISYPVNHANGTATTNGAAGKAWQIESTGLRNSQSGLKYNAMDYNLPTNNSTDAAGMELQPMLLNLQELEHAVATNGTINHAMRNTFALGVEASSNVWPATAFATDGSTVPFGARMRLKNSVNISTYSAIAQVLLTQLKQYGTLNADGGINYAMNAERTRWPKAYYDALVEMGNATIAGNMEFVRQDDMEVSTFSSLTKYNREIVTFTRTSDNATASVDVALQGPAVNFPQDWLYIMAGTPAQQLVVLNNYGGFTCSMSPTLGTLTSGCLYTPPTTQSVASTTTITVTSSVNGAVGAQMGVTVFPSTAIFTIPSQTADYTDTLGNLWTNRSGLSNVPDNQGCCACDAQANFSGTDVTLFKCVVGVDSSLVGDTKMNFLVPNGTYKVTHNYGTQSLAGVETWDLTVGSSFVYYNNDPSATAGGQYKNLASTTTFVGNGQLNVGIWSTNDQGSPVSSLSVVLVSSSAASSISSPSELWNGSSQIGGGVQLQ